MLCLVSVSLLLRLYVVYKIQFTVKERYKALSRKKNCAFLLHNLQMYENK